jgi:eukaryotic-like serine/threonine-protein kinase
MIGVVAGNYRIVRQIGEGGMGAVFLAEHAILGRAAAIKVLHPELSQQREVVGRFFNEARAATSIRHPGIIEVYDFGYLPGGAAYIAMEFLEGESLATRLRRERRLAVGAALHIGRQIAAVLHAAHSKAITHRDLKPDNVFLVPDPEIGERVKLLDFGIAKLASEDANKSRTRTGVVMGTPVYMSPEQCRGVGTLDHRSDLYSLGCMLYELIAGRPPFNSDSTGDIIAHHLYFQPEPLRHHECAVPEPFEALIMSLLAKDPAMRPASAESVVAVLDRWRTWDVVPAITAVASVSAMPAAPAAKTYLGQLGPGAPTTLSGSAAALQTGVPSRRTLKLSAAVVLAVAVVAVFVVRASRTPPSVRSTVPVAPPTSELAPDPTKAAMRASMERFIAWAARHAGAPCPDAMQIDAVADQWGRPLRVTCVDQPGDQMIGLVSAGPDGTMRTDDDVSSWQLGREVTDPVRGGRWAASMPAPPPVTPAMPDPPIQQTDATPSRQVPVGSTVAKVAEASTRRDARGADRADARRAGRTEQAADKDRPRATEIGAIATSKVDAKGLQAPRPAEATGPKAAVRVDAKPIESSAPKAEGAPAGIAATKPADTASSSEARAEQPAPAGSKWGRLLGDGSSANAEVEGLLRQCRSAAAKNDCAVARVIAKRIADKDAAIYRDRVASDAAIQRCLTSK